MVLCWRNWRW